MVIILFTNSFLKSVIQYATEFNAVIVLEDLAEQSFYEPMSPLNLDITVAAISKLAKWHAASIFMAKEVSIKYVLCRFLLNSFPFI